MPYVDLLHVDHLPGGSSPFYDVGGERILIPIQEFENKRAIDDEVLRLILSAGRLCPFRIEPTLHDALRVAGDVLRYDGKEPSSVLVSAWDDEAFRRMKEKLWAIEFEVAHVFKVADLPPSMVIVVASPDDLGILCLPEHERQAGFLIHADSVVQVKIGHHRTFWDWVSDPTV